MTARRRDRITPERVARVAGEINDARDAAAAAFAEEQVRPRLQSLLDRAQRRLRDPIRFYQGMGTWLLVIETDHRRRENTFREAFSDGLGGDHRDRLRARIPELVEFTDLIDACEDRLDYVFGDFRPTVPPKSRRIRCPHPRRPPVG